MKREKVFTDILKKNQCLRSTGLDKAVMQKPPTKTQYSRVISSPLLTETGMDFRCVKEVLQVGCPRIWVQTLRSLISTYFLELGDLITFLLFTTPKRP